MNHLAHCLLSGNETPLLLGNFIADFIKMKEVDHLQADIKKGVELHRFIDEFTDHHSLVREAKNILSPTQGKYAPVTIDILFDHFLIKSWTQYSAEPMRSFVDNVYAVFEDQIDFFSSNMKPRVRLMILSDFLYSCEDEPRLRATFARMTNRASFPNHFVNAYDDMMAHYDALDDIFNDFFPELQDSSGAFIKTL